MARRRFFVAGVHSGKAQISGEEARHLTRVLRVEVGQRYELSDNQHVYLAEIESARKEHVVFRTIEKLETEALPVRITLLAALIKFDHFEWMLEKATELGVEAIVPVTAARSERGLDRAALKRIERWRKVVLESSQQARRSRLPVVDEPVALREVLNREATYRYVLDANGGPPLPKLLPEERVATDWVALLVGPEGGWTEEERSGFKEKGWTSASLGPLILRAETAAVAALAVVSTAWQA